MLAMLAAIAMVVARYIADNWGLVTDHQWHIELPWLLVALLCMSVFYIGLALGWQRVITWNGTIVPLRDSLWVWSRSSLALFAYSGMGSSQPYSGMGSSQPYLSDYPTRCLLARGVGQLRS